MAVTAMLMFFMTFYIVALPSPSQAIINYTTEPTSTTFSLYLNGVTMEDDCICGCSSSNSSGIEAEIAAIYKKLYLDATTTSQYRRKRTSAEDPRPSAQGIGYSGIICLVVAFLFFFVSDVLNVAMLFGNMKPPVITGKQS
ncbi:uncharacterized protein LOC121384467 [Gigantopelta aegis]|uniref:uncharacterized protein LOC121384467 n=1 Tax=Gigantopelta aegis TaxID=1735272 RepID=UPI001B888BD4|nr:uncharacterized protein LOC121384467 [Gigantopelta aegis]